MIPGQAMSNAAARESVRRGALRRGWLVALLVCVALLVPGDSFQGAAAERRLIRESISGAGFELSAWEVQAITQKVRDAFTRPGAELAAAAQQQLVRDYFDAVARIGELKGEVEQIYAEEGSAATAEAAPLEAELAAVRAVQAERRPAVERILEQQVSAVLAEQDLDTAGHIWPPVRFQFTESPNLLILSPRDRISYERGIQLNPTLSVEAMERIEARIEAALADRSALVEATGGFSSYPTMVLEYSALAWVVDTVAHEWVHTYLMLRPLGWNYADSGQMRTINETVASLVGDEVSLLVRERFYPDLVGAARWPRPFSMRQGWPDSAAAQANFDFGAFMGKTRLETDRLLAEGEIAAAEAYMEVQRQTLLDEGYFIRRLNQAYFAFHGSYAVGAFATDPIGAKLRALRARSASLASFIAAVAQINDPADLDALLAAPAG